MRTPRVSALERRDRENPEPVSARGFRPSAAQKMHLALAIQNRGLSPQERAEFLGLTYGTWLVWWRSRDFRNWWNDELYDAMSLEVGPALHALREMANDPKLDARDRIRAVEVFLGHMQRQRGSERQAAVLAILNAFSSTPGASLSVRAAKDAKGNEALEAEVRAARTEAEGADLGVLHATPSMAHAVARSVDVLREKLLAPERVEEALEIPERPAPLVAAPTVRKRVNATSSLLSEPGSGKPRAAAHLDDQACTLYPSIRTTGRERETPSTPAGGGVVENHTPIDEPSSVPSTRLGRVGDPSGGAPVEDTAGEGRPASGVAGETGRRCGACGHGIEQHETPGTECSADGCACGWFVDGGGGNSIRTPTGAEPAAKPAGGGPAGSPARRITADDLRSGLPAGAVQIDESGDRGVP